MNYNVQIPFTGTIVRPEQKYAEQNLHSALYTAHVRQRRRVKTRGGHHRKNPSE